MEASREPFSRRCLGEAYHAYMTAHQQARSLLAKYRNIVPGPPPIVRELPEDQLLADLRATERVAASFDQNSSEAQIVGNVVRGWLGHELRNRRFAREFPHLVS